MTLVDGRGSVILQDGRVPWVSSVPFSVLRSRAGR